MNESDISQKQADLYHATLKAFINESKKSVNETKRRYQQYVNKNFAKLTAADGGYILSQSGQPTMKILRSSARVTKRIGLR